MINPKWLKLRMSRTILLGPKDVKAIEVRLYMLNGLWCPNAYGNGKKYVLRVVIEAIMMSTLNIHFTEK